MTIGPDLALDPAQEFLATGSAAGYAEPEQAEPHSRMATVIAAGLLVSFALASRALREQPAPTTEADLKQVTAKVWALVAPTWMQLAVPAVHQAFVLGSTGRMSDDEVAYLARRYTEAMGEYVNDTSTQALLEGFQAQLNAGWDRELAWRRASEGYGLDRQGMRAYITPLLTSPARYEPAAVSDAVRATINALLRRRAVRLADNEAYAALQQGRALYWAWQAAMGLLPVDAQKRWITARDELVCPVCGPLDGVAVYLDETFESAGMTLNAPGAHPNCRCTLELAYPEIREPLDKAWDETRVKRDREGQFARVDTRTRVVDPAAAADAALVAQVLRRGAAEPAVADLTPTDSDLSAAIDLAAGADLSPAIDLTPADSDLAADAELGPEAVLDTPFGVDLRRRARTRKVLTVTWLPDKPEREEDTDTWAPPEHGYRKFSNQVVVNGADYYDIVFKHMRSPKGKDRFGPGDLDEMAHPALIPEKGGYVDIDATERGRYGPGGYQPPALRGHQDGVDGIGWIPQVLDYMQYKGQVGNQAARDSQSENDNYITEWMYSDLDDRDSAVAHIELDPKMIAALARRNAQQNGAHFHLPPDWSQMDSQAKAEWIYDEYEEEKLDRTKGPDVWRSAVEDGLVTILGSNYSAEATTENNLIDTTLEGEIPDLIVFDGHFGTREDIVEGRYRVADVSVHRLNLMQRQALREEIDDRQYGRWAAFDQVRVIRVVPVAPAWVPQRPDEMGLSAPLDFGDYDHGEG